MRKRPKHICVETSRHGAQMVFFRKGHGPRLRLPPLQSAGFLMAYEAALAGRPVPHVKDFPRTPVEHRKQRTERVLKRCLAGARQRARTRGLPFDLDLSWALEEVDRHGLCCAVTGIEFFMGHSGRSLQNPYAPSLDRIDPSLGYVRGNVRIITFALNTMLLDWGSEVFEKVANSYRYQLHKRHRESLTMDPVSRTFRKVPRHQQLTREQIEGARSRRSHLTTPDQRLAPLVRDNGPL